MPISMDVIHQQQIFLAGAFMEMCIKTAKTLKMDYRLLQTAKFKEGGPLKFIRGYTIVPISSTVRFDWLNPAEVWCTGYIHTKRRPIFDWIYGWRETDIYRCTNPHFHNALLEACYAFQILLCNRVELDLSIQNIINKTPVTVFSELVAPAMYNIFFRGHISEEEFAKYFRRILK